MSRAFVLSRAVPPLVAPALCPRCPTEPPGGRAERWATAALATAAVVVVLRRREPRMGGYKGKGGGGKGGQGGPGNKGRPQKPTDDPDFVRWSKQMRLEGSSTGSVYAVEDHVASGSFSRVFRVSMQGGGKRRWGKAAEGSIFAAKVMRKEDSYIQYTSSGPREGDLLQRLEAQQRNDAHDDSAPLTMRCFDSFATKDDAGKEYWCLILEWLDASLYDVVRANQNRGLHLSMVRILLRQLLEQLKVLQELQCTHTDIKHKNCCLANTEYYLAPSAEGHPTMILTEPLAKFIDYGNAVFEGDKKPHPIHTKQFRAPEVLLNVREGWGPASDTWTLGVTGCFLLSGQLIFNSHDPQELIHLMRDACGPFPPRLLSAAQDGRLRRVAESLEGAASSPQLASWLKLAGSGPAEAACADLLSRMLALDPMDRITAAEALQHDFLAENGDGAKAVIPPRTSELRKL